jgi:hypothetical protein
VEGFWRVALEIAFFLWSMWRARYPTSMTEGPLAAVRSSFRRAQEGDFARKFYELLLASDPGVRLKFANTDFTGQRELFTHGVYSMLDFAEGKALGKMALQRLAVLHARGNLDIPEYMYGLWAKCFIAALWQADPELNEDLAFAWMEVLQPSLDLLQR